MASTVCMAGSCGGGFLKGRRRRHMAGGGGVGAGRVTCSAASSSSPYYMGSMTEHYRTLGIQPGASEKEVKKAFRRLALQYHPDVCKGSNCGVQFHLINEAYDSVMSCLKGEGGAEGPAMQSWNGNDGYVDEEMRGMHDPSWELWEEWMGWEGAGIRDYSSHINPYI